MKILALMPCYKIMEVPAVQSLCALQADVYSRNDNMHIVFANGFNAPMARTSLYLYAVEKAGEVDWVLNLDSDHIYSAKALYSLIEIATEKNLPLLSATYFVRGMPKKTAHGRYVEDGKFEKFKEEELNGELMEADVLGFGFLLMRQSFIKQMVEKYDRDIFHMDAHHNGDEAVYFCKKAQDLGHKMLFDPNNKVGHLTTVVNV
ncbi:MAG: hypothetical protein DRJ03_03550 [Chloroflexi bacterium]|nr:MAG: hypothetical protein DRJ03_03550 [Chloroflexota bacterium]